MVIRYQKISRMQARHCSYSGPTSTTTTSRAASRHSSTSSVAATLPPRVRSPSRCIASPSHVQPLLLARAAAILRVCSHAYGTPPLCVSMQVAPPAHLCRRASSAPTLHGCVSIPRQVTCSAPEHRLPVPREAPDPCAGESLRLLSACRRLHQTMGPQRCCRLPR